MKAVLVVAVGAFDDALGVCGGEAGGVVIEVHVQRAVVEAAAGGCDLLIAIKKGCGNHIAFLRKLNEKGDFVVVIFDGAVPQALE